MASIRSKGVIAVDEGRGRAVVFVHGYPLNHSIWLPQLARLKSSCRVILLDLPGYGAAWTSEMPSDLRGFSESVYDALRSISVDRAVVIGHSFGGYVSLQLMGDHPEVFGALMLADTRAAADTAEAREKRLHTVERLRRPGGHLDVDEVVGSLVAKSTLSGNPTVVARVKEIVATARAEAVIPTLLAIANRPDLHPVLPGIRVPTTVIWGEEDRLIPPADSQGLVAGIAKAVGVGVSGAGHLPCLESPVAFSTEIERLLERLPVR